MVVRSVRPLKQEISTYESAVKYLLKVKKGSGKHHDANLEIHYNARKVVYGKWSVVVVDDPLPKIGKPCVECSNRVLDLEDYLCTSCREATQA